MLNSHIRDFFFIRKNPQKHFLSSANHTYKTKDVMDYDVTHEKNWCYFLWNIGIIFHMSGTQDVGPGRVGDSAGVRGHPPANCGRDLGLDTFTVDNMFTCHRFSLLLWGIVHFSYLWLFSLILHCLLSDFVSCHYHDVTMDSIASLITSITIVYSAVYSGSDQRKYQSSASLAFVRGIHRGPVNSPHKWPVTRKMFPFDDVIMPRGQIDGFRFDHQNICIIDD